LFYYRPIFVCQVGEAAERYRRFRSARARWWRCKRTSWIYSID